MGLASATILHFQDISVHYMSVASWTDRDPYGQSPDCTICASY